MKTQTIALFSGGDRFEDFFDKIGVSLETFRDQFTGGWLFNYIEALRLVGVRTVLVYTTARVTRPERFTHAASQATMWVLPSPLLHKKIRNGQRRFFPDSKSLVAAASYAATPLIGLTKVLRHEQCDAILCQEYEHPRFDTFVLLGRMLGLPVFASYQGANETQTRMEQPLRRLSIVGCSGLIIPSRDEIARVRRTYRVAAEKIGVIPNPVEVVPSGSYDRATARAELGIGSNTRVVAWHGRVQIETKGLDVLLDAWDRICSARPDGNILLLLVGSGRDADELRRRLASTQKVRWVDRYVFNRRELWSYLSAADVYTIPSRREGFAVAVVEAMACGLPPVASDAPGVAEILPGAEDDGGIIVPRENHQALSVALLRLLDEPALTQRLGAIARRRVEEEFSLQVVGNKLRNFLFPRDRPLSD